MLRRRYLQTELLLLRCRNGDVAGFEELVSSWQQRLYYYIRRLVDSDDEALDALQETWIQVVRGIRRVRDPACLSSWLYRTARNVTISQNRKQRAPESLPDEDGDLAQQTVADIAFTVAEAAAVHAALDSLPIHQREAIALQLLEGFSLVEIADITGVSAGTVRSRLHYGKKALREALEREGYDDR